MRQREEAIKENENLITKRSRLVPVKFTTGNDEQSSFNRLFHGGSGVDFFDKIRKTIT